ncbi:MAG TPA: helix-turn-helix domain-containing protein [Burkholderiales bacterium]|nr:helix-turn-helix domain-containing protein [Burkholderiales bacterium]
MTEPEGLGVGRALAQAREAQGLEIADVAQQLKFMPRQIEALEAERFASLPGPTIARGMVRSYARLLKLEAEPLLSLMEGHVRSPDPATQLGVRRGEPVPMNDGGRRSTAIYLGVSVAVLAVAGAAVYEWRQEKPLPQFVAASDLGSPPATAAPPAAAPAVALAKAPQVEPVKAPLAEPAKAPPAEADAGTVQDEEKTVATAPTTPPRESSAETTQDAKPKPSVRPGSVVLADASPPAAQANRLVFRFEDESWVEVVDAQGRRLISSLNAAGTERSLRARPPLNIVVGNAQHVRVTYNGREIDLKPHIRVEVARFVIQ